MQTAVELESKDPESPPLPDTPQKLRYLHTFTPEALEIQIERLNKKYRFIGDARLTPQKLDDKLTELLENDGFYWLYNKFQHVLLWLANYGSNGLFFIFPIITGKAGLQTLARFFDPEAELPDWTGVIVAIIASLDILGYMFVFSARDCALIATYEAYQYWQKSTFQHGVDALQSVRNAPGKALISLPREAILLTTNVVGSFTEVVFYLPLIASPVNQWLFIITAAYFCCLYYKHYMDDDFRTGFKDMFRRRNGYFFREGNFLIALQILAQTIAAVGLRTQYYKYVVDEMYAALETEPNLFLSACLLACVALHSLFVYFPPIKKTYLVDLKDKEQKLAEFSNLTGTQQENLAWVTAIMDAEITFIRKENGWFYSLKKDKVVRLFVLLNTAYSAYLGYGAADLLFTGTPKIIFSVFTIPLAAILFNAPLLVAESHGMARKKYLKEPENTAKSEGKIIAIILTACTAIALFLSSVGTLSSPENTPTALLALFLLYALQRMISYIVYGFPKVQQTVASQIKSCPRISQCVGTLFSCRKTRPQALPPPRTDFALVPARGVS